MTIKYKYIDNLVNKINGSKTQHKKYLIDILRYKDGNRYLNDKFYLCQRIEDGLRRQDTDPKYSRWLEGKMNQLLKEKEERNLSAILGEVRALGFLYDIFDNSITPRGGKGCDFTVDYNGKPILIEVNTPLGATKDTNMEHENVKQNNIQMQVSEIAPMGFPKRHRDNFQGEAISKLAGIKDTETQFKAKATNILWIDLLDPHAWKLNNWKDQCEPFLIWNSTITWGAIWHSIYGKKGDKIYDRLETQCQSDKAYVMEFGGKFQKKSLVDFAIITMPNCTVIFENYKRKQKDKELYQHLFNCSFLDLYRSWVNFPTKDLRIRVCITRRTGKKYSTKFDSRKY
ncbi:MAG: hypothetical protein SRB2_00242 [Desulfobacteraceae bacterium Eth-SRB2]|nr:MAG: hypothetical protein SRB2_00242 [Desulfobacteraceae bacterium Eth-SRB2]